MGEFSDKVFAVVQRVPRGKVTTYGQVARMIGSPRSARYVGYVLRGNPEPGADAGETPCHRVVFKDGRLCEGYAFGGPDVQRRMLEEEGVAFADDNRVDLEACLWDGREDADVGIVADDLTIPRSASSPKTHPLAPPPDFDWARELEESQHRAGRDIRLRRCTWHFA